MNTSKSLGQILYENGIGSPLLTTHMRWEVLPDHCREDAQKMAIAVAEECAKVCDENADYFGQLARGGDDTGASDHMFAASRDCASDIRELYQGLK